MSDPGLSVPFSPLAGTSESRWLRLVQVGAEDNAATFDQAAELIDSLYDISPCDTGTEGTGGDAADESELPDEDGFLALAGKTLGELCDDQDHWDARVDLLRSHQTPAAYGVRGGTATLVKTELVTETRTETVSLDGADHHDLEYPYHGGLTVRGAEVADVRGSTVNFARPATGRVRLTYVTRHERLTLRVPATPGDSGQAVAEAAAVIVFWDRRAAQLDLKQPEPDDGIDAAELARLCRSSGKDKDTGGDCWKTIRHYVRCACSGGEAPGREWEETVSAPCPEGVKKGRRLGTERHLDNYEYCPGEQDGELHDREYYKKICCEYPPQFAILPYCPTTRAVYRGGAEIQGGADHWRSIYGDDVILTAVTPEGGVCGEVITRWNVQQQNCCDDIIPLAPHPNNPTAIHANERHRVGAVQETGRRGDLIWTLHGGITFPDGTTQKVDGARVMEIVAGPTVCPRPWVKLDDGCQPLTLYFEGGGSTLPEFGEDYEDMAIAPETVFSLTVGGGVPPYMWIVGGGLELLGISEDTKSAMMRTKGRLEWCVEQVRAQDQCGEQAVSTIRNSATGSWTRMTEGVDYDRCSAPGGASIAITPAFSGYMWLKPAGGWSVQIYRNGRQPCGGGAKPCGEGHLIAKNTDDILRDDCNRTAGSVYTKTYSDGYCRIVRQGDGYSVCWYYHDNVAAAYKWVCA